MGGARGFSGQKYSRRIKSQARGIVAYPLVYAHHIFRAGGPAVRWCKAIVRDNDSHSFPGKALADVLSIGLIAANEPAAGDEYHDRTRRGAASARRVNIQALAGIVPIRDVAVDVDSVAPLTPEQRLIHRLRKMQIEDCALRADAFLPCGGAACTVEISLLHGLQTASRG